MAGMPTRFYGSKESAVTDLGETLNELDELSSVLRMGEGDYADWYEDRFGTKGFGDGLSGVMASKVGVAQVDLPFLIYKVRRALDAIV